MKTSLVIFLLKWMLKALTFMRIKDKDLEKDIEKYLEELEHEV